MDHFAGLDVSVKETSVCIVDDTGKIIREVKVASAAAGFGRAGRPIRPLQTAPRSSPAAAASSLVGAQVS